MRRDLIIPGIVAPLAAIFTALLILLLDVISDPPDCPAGLGFWIIALLTVGLLVAYLYTFFVTIPMATRHSGSERIDCCKLYLAAIYFSAIFLIILVLGGGQLIGPLFFTAWFILPSSLAGALTFHLVHRLSFPAKR
jgi:ABC-type transport system involved in cytochrome c biogenesis permease subunit